MIADTPRFAALEALALVNCGLSRRGVEALLASPYLSRELVLVIEDELYDDAVAARFPVTSNA